MNDITSGMNHSSAGIFAWAIGAALFWAAIACLCAWS